MFSSNTSQVEGGYQISRSLRFNSADSAYLNRTPASAGNRKTWTVSCWVKRGEIGTRQGIFGNPDASGLSGIYCEFISDVIQFGEYSTVGWNWIFNTSAVYRDPSAWYHFVFAVDTTQATASNRVKIYVNGVQVTSFSTATYPSQNSDTFWNNTQAAAIGRLGLYSGFYFGGYITEIYNIDGQALTPSSFGETNAQTGVWQPKAYAGSYGTNGFYLNFSDNSNTTAATLGKDYSGNGNNWTPNNFSVSAGAGNDSLVDVPTNWGADTGAGGEVRGNYCTFNPLKIDTNLSLANGNLDLTRANSSGWKNAEATVGVQSGKWYFEITPTGANLPANFMLGVGDPTQIAVDAYLGGTSRVWGYQGNGNYYNNGTTYGSKPTISANDVVMVAYDLDSGKLWFGKNGSWNGGGSPASGTSADFTNLTGTISAAAGWFAAGTAYINFGQRPFAYTAPSGFKALCTQNLPTPTIGATTATQAANYFNPVIYAGDSTSNRTITTGLQSDFVWIKNRTSTGPTHILFDVIRGAGQTLYSSSTSAEVNNGGFYVQQFNSTNFLLGSSDTASNDAGQNYVSWVWRANGAGSSNTAGSITSTVSANTTSGFSIVTYTGTGANATIGHGLGAAPRMIIVKRRNGVDIWPVYNEDIGNTQYLRLNGNNPAGTFNVWQNTSPTSSVFYVSTDSTVNANAGTYVAYCFAEIPGYSRIRTYVGNGSTDGPFVFTGFRPKFLLIKVVASNISWSIEDGTRSPSNVVSNILYPDLSNAEDVGPVVDFLSNGFKIRTISGTYNDNGSTYIFMALAESPFKFALAR